MSLRTPLKSFQKEAVGAAVSTLGHTLKLLERAQSDHDAQDIIRQGGYLLLEAPTGIGKTLIAAHITENLAQASRIVWFWFTPFAGLVEQTARTLKGEGFNLRIRQIASDRNVEDLRSGDLFITTWSSAAVSNADSRKIRRDGESMPSFDGFLTTLRQAGYRIGVVIDEAHHSFRTGTQATDFYQNVLAPDLTILVTATPRDEDVTAFRRMMNLPELPRISIARSRGVDAGLLKTGVKVGLLKRTDEATQGLINFEETALQCGVATHQNLKRLLDQLESTVRPLLLVQVDSTPGSVEKAKDTLVRFGMPESRIRVHTADEPDHDLLSLAHDDEVEVLIFKMAVATGFDAPRAFTLVSLRSARDPEFGVQVVGRLMRVDRRLQGLTLPPALNYGYVFLTDDDKQQGLLTGAARINAIQDELSKVSPRISVQTLEFPASATTAAATDGPESDAYQGTGVAPSSDTASGQAAGQPLATGASTAVATLPRPTTTSAEHQAVTSLLSDWGLTPTSTTPASSRPQGGSTTPSSTSQKEQLWPLRSMPGAPAQFKRAVISPEQTNLLEEIVERFNFDDELIALTMQNAARILIQTVEVFTQKKDRPEEIHARLAQAEIDRQAQQTLLGSVGDGLLDVRKLHDRLAEALRSQYVRRGMMDQANSPELILNGLHKILVLRPKALRYAIQETTKNHMEVIDAHPLPQEVKGEGVDQARLNLYGIFPDDLNEWEHAFAKLLDDDLTDTIAWWHRNPVRKPHSVAVPLPGQHSQNYYFPDFVVGVPSRTKTDGVSLVEVKRDLNDVNGNARSKVQVEHPTYRRILMVHLDKNGTWRVVDYDASRDLNVLGQEFRVELLKHL